MKLHLKIWPWHKRLPYVLGISACITLFLAASLFQKWLTIPIGILLILLVKAGQDAYLEEHRKYFENR